MRAWPTTPANLSDIWGPGLAKWIIHISMTFAWVYAVLGAMFIADRPIEVAAACIFVVVVPFVYIALLEDERLG